MQILRDFILAPVLVFFVTNPPMQISPIILLFVAFLLVQTILKPLKSKLELYTLVINDFLYILALSSFLIYHFRKDSLTEEERYNTYGFAIIGILAAIVLANILIGFYVCSLSLRSMCKKKGPKITQNLESGIKKSIKNKALRRRQNILTENAKKG
jgi:hypothetical protein